MSSLGKSMSDINLGMLYLAREVLQKDEALVNLPNFNYLGLLGGQQLVVGQVPVLAP
jgi:hypothetical protein